MSVGVLLISFGEPDEPTAEEVTSFLERIFLRNAALEGLAHEAAAARARHLASERAPGLLEEYRAIGGSPLVRQAEAQVAALRGELQRRGLQAEVFSAYQFINPSVADTVAAARAQGVDTLVALPAYPLCGYSTTVAALDDVRSAMREMDWTPRFLALAGWHYHPDYVSLRARNVRSFVDDSALDLNDSNTLLYFSAHGTPLRYLRENRYDRYVFEHCRDVARALGNPRYAVGFQNHSNRGIPWTRPDNEDRLRGVEERRVVVVPISFLKEQSETLAELDHALRDFALERGKEFHRVPVPHDDAALRVLLADLVCALLSGDPAAGGSLSRCHCCPGDGTWCTNGLRDLPPSPASPETEVDS